MGMDDFSFPKVLTDDDHTVNLTVTPSLWRISSLVFPDNNNNHHHHEDDDTNSTMHHNLERKSSCKDEGFWAEENMDTLWEDMNDDDLRSRCIVKGSKSMTHHQHDELSNRVQITKTNSLQFLKKSKINTVAIKVFKKLFSQRIFAHIKKR